MDDASFFEKIREKTKIKKGNKGFSQNLYIVGYSLSKCIGENDDNT